MAPVLRFDDVHLDFLSRTRAGGGRHRDRLKRVAGAQQKTRIPALNGVSLTVEPGEVVAVVGPPESGMTTLLRVAAGVLRPDSGTVSYPRDRLAWFSGARLTDNALSLRQNIDLLVGLYARPAVGDPEFAARCAAAVELGDRINAPMDTLPGGSGSRLGLVVALSLPAPLYLLDGPLDAGTREFRDLVRGMIVSARDSGAAVVLSTDKASTLLGLATRAIRLKKGRVVDDGPADAILSRPERKGSGKRKGSPRPVRRRDDDEDDDAYG